MGKWLKQKTEKKEGRPEFVECSKKNIISFKIVAFDYTWGLLKNEKDVPQSRTER